MTAPSSASITARKSGRNGQASPSRRGKFAPGSARLSNPHIAGDTRPSASYPMCRPSDSGSCRHDQERAINMAGQPFGLRSQQARAEAPAAGPSHHQQVCLMRSRGGGQLLREVPDADLGADLHALGGGVGSPAVGEPQRRLTCGFLSSTAVRKDLRSPVSWWHDRGGSGDPGGHARALGSARARGGRPGADRGGRRSALLRLRGWRHDDAGYGDHGAAGAGVPGPAGRGGAGADRELRGDLA